MNFYHGYAERFWSKVLICPEHSCWEWLEGKQYGYGVCYYERWPYRAHRIALMLSGVKIPEGMVVDHKCRNKGCVNPNHLRVVTPKVNVTENSLSAAAINKAKTHCLRGHPFDQKNTGHDKKGRYCKSCKILKQREWRAR